jgi:hypothetical protein
MGSGAMIYKPSFIKIGSGIQRLGGGYTYRHRQQGDLISLLVFFQAKKEHLLPSSLQGDIIGLLSFLQNKEVG